MPEAQQPVTEVRPCEAILKRYETTEKITQR